MLSRSLLYKKRLFDRIQDNRWILLNMDDASEDSRPAQPGLIKKFFFTISTVRDSLAMFFFYTWSDHHLNSLNSLEFIIF